MNDDAIISGQVSAKDAISLIGNRVSQCLPPPEGSRPISTWKAVEWFSKRSETGKPGEWATPRIYDISGQVTPAELAIWGTYGDAEFNPDISRLSTMIGGAAIRVFSPEQMELAKKLARDIHVCRNKVLASLEKCPDLSTEKLYGDADEVLKGNLSPDMVKQRRFLLLEIFEGVFRTALRARMALPDSNDFPNRKIIQAFLSGWFVVGYVGTLKGGSPVVFHPAQRCE